MGSTNSKSEEINKVKNKSCPVDHENLKKGNNDNTNYNKINECPVKHQEIKTENIKSINLL